MYYQVYICSYRIADFFHGWKFSLFNFSWVDILAFGATLHRICIVEEILEELIFGALALQRKYKPSKNNPLYGMPT